MKWFSMHKIKWFIHNSINFYDYIFTNIDLKHNWECKKNEHLLIYSRVILVSQGPR